jgi:hypothetical protein
MAPALGGTQLETKMTGVSDARRGPEPRDGDTRGIRRIRDAADETLQAGREITEIGTDAVAQTADTLADVTRHPANQGSEVVRSGLRAFAGAQQSPDTSYSQGRRAVEADVRGFVGYYAQLGRGFIQMQHSYFDVLRRSMEAAEVQRELYRNAVTTTIEASRTVLLATAQATQSAMQPFQRRG